MNSKRLTLTVAVMLWVTPLSQLQLAAQNKAKQDHTQNPHHYQLVDLGSTFGGPQSYFVPGSGEDFGGSSVLNSGGTVAGFADTSMPDPFPNFCWSADCLVGYSFEAGSNGVLTNLGALPGGGSSAPIWITTNGLIAGISENGETDPLYPGGFPENHAVLWQQGQIMDLGTLPEGGYQSEANAVNSAGQVVGSALNTIPDANSMAVGNFWYFNVPYGYQQRAFLWDKRHGMQDLGTLPGGTDAEALLINEPGQVVGYSYTASTQSGACYPLATSSFIWEREKGMTDLGGFGGTCTLPSALNNQGQVVGGSDFTGDQSASAFLWENGSMHALGGSLGGDQTWAYAINEQGEAVGFGNLPGNNTFHATLWKNVKSITDLGVLGNDPCSYAAAINAERQVVGGSGCGGNGFRAFLWENGSIFDLNTLIPPGSALYLQFTNAINDSGEIAGTGVDASGNGHAFLLIPCDENHPGIEGCDYSLVDESAAPQVQAPRNLPSGTQRPSRSRRSNRYHIPGLEAPGR
jgi:probable HAF family extracellular repeat protein